MSKYLCHHHTWNKHPTDMTINNHTAHLIVLALLGISMAYYYNNKPYLSNIFVLVKDFLYEHNHTCSSCFCTAPAFQQSVTCIPLSSSSPQGKNQNCYAQQETERPLLSGAASFTAQTVGVIISTKVSPISCSKEGCQDALWPVVLCILCKRGFKNCLFITDQNVQFVLMVKLVKRGCLSRDQHYVCLNGIANENVCTY